MTYVALYVGVRSGKVGRTKPTAILESIELCCACRQSRAVADVKYTDVVTNRLLWHFFHSPPMSQYLIITWRQTKFFSSGTVWNVITPLFYTTNGSNGPFEYTDRLALSWSTSQCWPPVPDALLPWCLDVLLARHGCGHVALSTWKLEGIIFKELTKVFPAIFR